MPDSGERILAIMLKAPRAGHVKTRLAAAYGGDEVVRLYRALVEDTIDLARAAKLKAVAVCPSGDEAPLAAWLPPDVAVLPQRGAGLAAGLHSTFEQLCDPPRKVVAFNGDSPHLPPAVLTAAFAALDSDDLVVGPCDDGGYYLVGATRSHPGLFDAAAMGTGSAFEALLAHAKRLGLRVSVAAEHWDVDVPSDVVRLASELARAPERARRTAALLAALGVARAAPPGSSV